MPPSNRLMGICPWMESDFRNRIDYYGVAFSIDWNGVAHFRDFRVKNSGKEGFKKKQTVIKLGTHELNFPKIE